MKQVRIYQPGPYETGQTIELSSAATQHVAVVLRMQKGDKLILFCGDNREFSATICEIHKKKVWVHIDDVQSANRESPLSIHLAQAISKGERMEFVIQKAVELGVVSIVPIITERCVVRLNDERLCKKQVQWQSIAISAVEQSERNVLPIVHQPISLSHYVQTCSCRMRLILDPQSQKTWRDYSKPTDEMALLIGPEGGFSPEEVSLALTHSFHSLRLGPRILRTETAAIAAISVLQAIQGDF